MAIRVESALYQEKMKTLFTRIFFTFVVILIEAETFIVTKFHRYYYLPKFELLR